MLSVPTDLALLSSVKFAGTWMLSPSRCRALIYGVEQRVSDRKGSPTRNFAGTGRELTPTGTLTAHSSSSGFAFSTAQSIPVASSAVHLTALKPAGGWYPLSFFLNASHELSPRFLHAGGLTGLLQR